MTDDELRELANPTDNRPVFASAIRPLAEELLSARATLSAIASLCRHQRQAGGEIDPPLSGDMLAYRVLELIDPPAKGT